ncbi:hypothetical protein QJS10_CPB04g00963 [Acorus calamus]|uniref:PP4R3 EVH1-like domain-containing protein n=1 Tax=Acorus calamus TaxID=4465 RepID=A0AAV9EYD3_ACOCL|nr:hypothetical protein QJS10_CPB04g00963 [Acorus calamus]
MGAQGKAAGAAGGDNSLQRVKVYRLSADGKWDDQGTGHVTVDYMERSEDLGLFVYDEDDHDPLLMHRISTDEIYRRQDETIISWRDPEYSTELALSFQEATDIEIGPRPATEALPAFGAPQANGDAYHVVNSELRDLPLVELSSLPMLLKSARTKIWNSPGILEESTALKKTKSNKFDSITNLHPPSKPYLTVVEGAEGGVAEQMRVTELILQDVNSS